MAEEFFGRNADWKVQLKTDFIAKLFANKWPKDVFGERLFQEIKWANMTSGKTMTEYFFCRNADWKVQLKKDFLRRLFANKWPKMCLVKDYCKKEHG